MRSGIAGQRAQEGAPVGRIGACKRLCEPELGLARDKADAAEDIESHLASGDSLPLGSRARTRKGRWSSSSDPCVGQAVGRKGWNTTGAKPSTQSASNWPGLVSRSSPVSVSHRKRLRDSPGNELVVARRLGSFASLELPLPVFARAVPGPSRLPRQNLGEHVRLSAPSWQARIALSSVAGFSVSTVQLHARACVL